MTDFNALPLTEQLKQLQPGDELHLRGGGWLPAPIKNEAPFINFPDICGLSWHMCDGKLFRSNESPLDIIRVVRPTPKEQAARKVPRKVPHVVDVLLNFDGEDYICPATGLAHILAYHFERGE